MDENVLGSTHITNYLGLDLGDRTSWVHIRNAAGEFVEEARLSTTQTALRKKFADQPPLRIALELGGQSRWVSWLLRGLGHEVVVADARQLRLIFQNPRKNDRVDAEYLAKLVRLDESLLAPIRQRGEEAQQDLAILRSQDILVQVLTKLINHTRGLFKSFGTRVPSCSAANFAR